MFLVFALAAFVQWNDPDPLPWIALYALAALLSLAAAAGRFWLWPSVAAAGLYLVGVLSLLPALVDARASAFTSWKMRTSPTRRRARRWASRSVQPGWSC